MRAIIFAMALTVAASLITLAPSASADTLDCVSRAEYRKVHRGDTRSRVTRIFDIPGRRQGHASSGGYQTEVRSYHTCSRFSAVSISFDKHGKKPWKLVTKSAVWVD